jgi:hypothetical protein
MNVPTHPFRNIVCSSRDMHMATTDVNTCVTSDGFNVDGMCILVGLASFSQQNLLDL